VKTSKSKSGGLQMKMITKPSCAWTAGNKKVSLLAAGIFLSLCAFAAEPVWPLDFAAQVAANRAAAAPGESQIGTADEGVSVGSVRKLDEKYSSAMTFSTKRYNRFAVVFR
jgi:hypothetical protein